MSDEEEEKKVVRRFAQATVVDAPNAIIFSRDYSGKTHAAMMRAREAANRSRAEPNPFSELKSKIDGLWDTNETKVLDDSLRDRLIQYLKSEMEKHNAGFDRKGDTSKTAFSDNDIKWLKDVQGFIRSSADEEKEALRIKLIDQQAIENEPTTTSIAYFTAFDVAESERVGSVFGIVFNIEQVVTMGIDEKQLQALFIHELRHFWQQKSDVWRGELGAVIKELFYHNVRIEVDAYNIQFKLEQNFDIFIGDEEMKDAFQQIEEEYSNRQSEMDDWKAVELSKEGRYDKNHGYINMPPMFVCSVV